MAFGYRHAITFVSRVASMTTLTANAYLQIKRDWGTKAKVVRVTQSKPSIPDPDAVVVKVKISIPSEMFVPPEAEVTIPLAAVQRPPVQIEPVTT